MWSWTLNWSGIRRDLIAGSCPRELEDVARIRDQTRASALLCLQSDDCLAHFGIDYAAHRRHARRLGLAMERVPMRDFDVEDQHDKLAAAVGALCRLLSNGTASTCTARLGWVARPWCWWGVSGAPTTSRSMTRKRFTSSSSISSRRIRDLPMAKKPTARRPIARAPSASAPHASALMAHGRNVGARKTFAATGKVLARSVSDW